jgi:hypothetical protein
MARADAFGFLLPRSDHKFGTFGNSPSLFLVVATGSEFNDLHVVPVQLNSRAIASVQGGFHALDLSIFSGWFFAGDPGPSACGRPGHDFWDLANNFWLIEGHTRSSEHVMGVSVQAECRVGYSIKGSP